jgi:hypothetical protein
METLTPVPSAVVKEIVRPIVVRFVAWAGVESAFGLLLTTTDRAIIITSTGAMAIADASLAIAGARRAAGPVAQQVPGVVIVYMQPSCRLYNVQVGNLPPNPVRRAGGPRFRRVGAAHGAAPQ